MKVVCIKNVVSSVGSFLTIGKEYETYNDNEEDVYYLILNDINSVIKYPTYMFKTISALREEKINSILK